MSKLRQRLPWPTRMGPLLSVDCFDTIGLWHRRLKSRHELRHLDAEQMRDVGLDPLVVQREAQKPFWLA